MTFSHPFNALAKILFGVIGVGLAFALGYGLDLTSFGPESIGKHGYPVYVEIAYYLALVCLPLLFTWRFVYLPYLMPAGNWLFLLVGRKTRIPWNDCVRLSSLFVGDKKMAWFPVEELPRVPEDQRLAYLYDLAEKTGRLKSPRNTGELVQDVQRSNQPVTPPQGEEPKRSFWKRELSQRGIGVILFVCGMALSYLSVISPLLGASCQAESLDMFPQGAIAVPFALVAGLVYMLFGDGAARVLGALGPGRRPTALGWAFLIILIGAGFLLYFWLNSVLRSYGYMGPAF